MDFDVIVYAVPKGKGKEKVQKYLLAKSELSTEMGDEIIANFEDSYLQMEQNLLKVQKILSQQPVAKSN